MEAFKNDPFFNGGSIFGEGGPGGGLMNRSARRGSRGEGGRDSDPFGKSGAHPDDAVVDQNLPELQLCA